jgi:RHS repeat-associated protein
LGLGQAGLVSKDNTIPKAYINYLFFDTENNFKKGGYKQVSEAALGSFEELDLEYVPEEEGTMMIYTANQTAEDLDVYMDDLTILHTEGPIIRVDDYYPFGLTYHTSERTGYTTNNFLYNGNELQTELSLDLHDFNKRFYDAKLGRFISVDPLSELPSQYNKSPYQYGWNNPILLNDPNGDCPCLIPAIPWAIGIAEAIFFAGSATAITYVAYEQLGPDYDNLRVGTVHNPYEGSYLNTRDPKQPDFNIAKKVALIGTAMGLVARLMEKNAKFAGYEQIQIEEALKTMTPEELRDFNNRLRAALSLTYQKGDLTDQQAFGLANPSMLEAATIYNFTKDVYSLERGLTEEEQSKEDEKSEKGKKASQMINNFSNLEQGTYKWNGSDWVLE